jgi:hypothetical protein
MQPPGSPVGWTFDMALVAKKAACGGAGGERERHGLPKAWLGPLARRSMFRTDRGIDYRWALL